MPAISRAWRAYTSSVEVMQGFAMPPLSGPCVSPAAPVRMNAGLRVHCPRHLSAYTGATPNDADTHAQRIDGSNRRRREA